MEEDELTEEDSVIILNSVSPSFLDMVQLEQYDTSPSVSVETDATVEVIFKLLVINYALLKEEMLLKHLASCSMYFS